MQNRMIETLGAKIKENFGNSKRPTAGLAAWEGPTASFLCVISGT